MRRVGWILGVTVACGPIVDERSFTIEGDFDAVRVKLSNGEAIVGLAEGEAVELDVDFGGVGRPSSVGRYVEQGVLVIDYSCTLCGGDLELGIPDGMPVDITVLHGDLELVGLTGPVRGEVHTGSIAGEDLDCDTDVVAYAGSIELDWDFRPLAVQAETHVGALSLGVPAGPYRLDVGSNLGVVRLFDVVHDDRATSAISAFAFMGEVEIEGS